MVISALLMVYLSVAAAMDIKWQRVKNQWILFGIISGFLISFVDAGLFGDGGCHLEMGAPGLLPSILGFLLPLPLLFLYSFHLLGAGDIKLLMVSGIFLGAYALIECLPLMLMTAGVFAVISLIYNRKTIFKTLHRIPLAPAMLIGVIIWTKTY